MNLILVDTSVWTQVLRRKGDPAVRKRVADVFAQQRACWCEIIRTELWTGASTEKERGVLREFESMLPRLAINQDVWDFASLLSYEAGRQGFVIPLSDRVIFSCARVYEVELEHRDRHYAILEGLGVEPSKRSARPTRPEN